MKATVPYYKRRGETPKEALERLRVECPEYKNEVLSYAGRLDPLAEGLLVLLVGAANKEREKYLGLPKTYLLDILFGWSTDSYDVAGKLVEASDQRVDPLRLLEVLTSFEGLQNQSYPPYSSKPVEGKPLFEWARAGKLDDITIPTHTVEIEKIQLLKTRTISNDELWDYVVQSLDLLTGDFRQEEILACWEDNLKRTYGRTYDIVPLEIACSSGTYMRTLARDIGEQIGIPALAYSITRTKVGEYFLS